MSWKDIKAAKKHFIAWGSALIGYLIPSLFGSPLLHFLKEWWVHRSGPFNLISGLIYATLFAVWKWRYDRKTAQAASVTTASHLHLKSGS